MKRFLIAISLLLAGLLPASAQMTMTGVGGGGFGAAAPSYQGPGDIVSGALIWGSCARVYNAALASTSTSLCDLVDTSVGGTAICTLRGSSTGFVDLAGSYCTGSATPAVACAAAAGGACRVSKVYDQIGGTAGWVNATNGQRPVLTFSALNGLPGLTGTSAANTGLTTAATFSPGQPWSWVAVAKRTANFTTEQTLIGGSGAFNGYLAFSTSASTIVTSADGSPSLLSLGSVADSSFHAVQAVINNTSSVIAADGVENSGATNGTSMTAQTSRIMRKAGGLSLDGVWMEGGLWPSAFDGTQRTNMNTNMHGTSGYNF